MDAVLTTHQIARALSVDIGTVIRWIDGARLPAYRTPGGHRRVKRGDFENFVRSHNLPAPAAMARRRKSVLVVEDDEDFQRMIEGFLRLIRKDLAVHRADDGFLAGKMVESLKPDVVLLDLFLPGLNGFRVCEHIRQDPALDRTWILAVSARGSAEDQKRILRAGADAFLAKPFGLEPFQALLRGMLASPRRLKTPARAA